MKRDYILGAGFLFIVLLFSYTIRPDRLRATPFSQENTGGCNFDPADMEIFTTDAIKNYQPDARYVWDSVRKIATLFLNDSDTLYLQIGGCEVFNYAAAYRTEYKDFSNDSLLFVYVKWLSRSFFSSDFDTQYPQFIESGAIKLDSAQYTDKQRVYNVIRTDTTIQTNQHFNGFGIKKLNAQRAEIWVNGFLE